MKTLEQRRDELAHEFAAGNFDGDEPSIGSTHAVELSFRDLFEGDRENFKHGFDAAVAELRPEIEKLVKALEQCGHDYCIDPHPVFRCQCPKHKTLTKFKEFMGDNNG